MCIFKAYMLESTLLEILNPALTSRKYLLKDILMCTFKAYMLESTLLDILNPASTSRKFILKISGHSTKEDLLNSPCTLDILMCTFKPYMLDSQCASQHTPGRPIFLQSSHYIILEHSSFLF